MKMKTKMKITKKKRKKKKKKIEPSKYGSMKSPAMIFGNAILTLAFLENREECRHGLGERYQEEEMEKIVVLYKQFPKYGYYEYKYLS